MSIGLFLMVIAVAFIWSGAKNKDLRQAIPLFITGKDPNDADAISKPLLSDEPQSPSGGGGTSSFGVNLGKQTTWNRLTVSAYGIALSNQRTPWPSVRVSGQCRANNVRPPGGAANSLHYVKNGCRALDMVGKDSELLKLEKWAKSQGVFAEVIYSGETSYHRTGGANNHLHLGFKKSSKAPIIPGTRDSSEVRALSQ